MPGEVSMLTMDIDDGEGSKSEPSSAAQLPSHQLHDLSNLVIALLQKILDRAQKRTVS
jgi:hypothetical protein